MECFSPDMGTAWKSDRPETAIRKSMIIDLADERSMNLG
jgi:hypothetical protein